MSRLRHLLSPVSRRLETTVHPLRYLFVEVTQRCNLRCRHCGSDCGREARPHELETDEWLRFFAYLGSRVDVRTLVLCLTGGEPLCHPELGRLLEGLRANQLRFGVVTNGFALSQARLEALVQAGMTGITISLDGMEQSHDWLRGVRGSFRRAVAAIARTAGTPMSCFDVVTCVSPRNMGELPQVLALLRELKVPAWRLFSIFPRGRARDDGELILSAPGFQKLLAFIADARARERAGMSIQFSCEGYLPAAVDRAVRDEPFFCRAGISIGSVLCDGEIAACPNISRALTQGNIRSDDFLEVWEQRFAPFRDREWMRRGTCVACPEWKRCLGNSLHLRDEERGETARCTFAMARESGRAPR